MVYTKVAVVLLAVILFCRLGEAQDTVKKEVLLETTAAWDGTRYKSYPAGQPELSVLKITIPAHTALDWHTHPVPNAGYVLSGSLTVERKDGTKRRIVAGEALAESVGEVHRGVTGEEATVLIVFYAGQKGTPLAVASGGQ